MKKMAVGIILFAIASSAFAADWKTYRNEKYKYEIRYPDSWEMQEDRGGKAIVITRQKFTAPHGVTVRIFPELSLDKLLSEQNAPSLEELDKGPIFKTTTLHKITWKKVDADDLISVHMEVRGVDNKVLGMRTIFRDYVEFRVDFIEMTGEEISNRIIESFKWKTR